MVILAFILPSIFQFPKMSSYYFYGIEERVLEFNKIQKSGLTHSLSAQLYYVTVELLAQHDYKNNLLWQGGEKLGHFQLPFFISTLTYIAIGEVELWLLSVVLGIMLFLYSMAV